MNVRPSTGIDAALLAREHFGIEAEASRELPSYADRNFWLRAKSGAEFVLKLAGRQDDRACLAAQNQAMTRARSAGLRVPCAWPSRSGTDLLQVDLPGLGPTWVRMVSFLEGEVLARLGGTTPALREALGALLGRLDRALSGWSDPGLTRVLRWDLLRAQDMLPACAAIEASGRREAVRAHLLDFRARILPALAGLRRSPVHNDANDHNVIFQGDPENGFTLGLIDFGDLVESALVCEVAIAMTYMMLDVEHPAAAAEDVLRGYENELPLLPEERLLLPDLIRTRLCVSVSSAARERSQKPGNAYAQVSDACAWQLLDRLDTWHPELEARVVE